MAATTEIERARDTALAAIENRVRNILSEAHDFYDRTRKVAETESNPSQLAPTPSVRAATTEIEDARDTALAAIEERVGNMFSQAQSFYDKTQELAETAQKTLAQTIEMQKSAAATVDEAKNMALAALDGQTRTIEDTVHRNLEAAQTVLDTAVNKAVAAAGAAENRWATIETEIDSAVSKTQELDAKIDQQARFAEQALQAANSITAGGSAEAIANAENRWAAIETEIDSAVSKTRELDAKIDQQARFAQAALEAANSITAGGSAGATAENRWAAIETRVDDTTNVLNARIDQQALLAEQALKAAGNAAAEIEQAKQDALAAIANTRRSEATNFSDATLQKVVSQAAAAARNEVASALKGAKDVAVSPTVLHEAVRNEVAKQVVKVDPEKEC